MDKESSFTGRTALVTGAARRLGRAIALELARRGANVIAHYLSSPEQAESLCAEARGMGVKAWKLKADFSLPGEAERLMDAAFSVPGEAGGVDILINSASVFPPGALADMTLEDVNQNVLVNAWAPFALSRSFAARRGEGRIINLLDTRVRGFDSLHAAYHLSKHLLALLTRLTALEFAPGVTVNAVAPGLILAPRDADYDDGRLERLGAGLPLKKRGRPEDVTAAVMFLLESTFITGQVLYVDGGRHLREGDYG